MKKSLIVLSRLICCMWQLHAQTLLSSREPAVRHSKGMSGVCVEYYWDKYGYSSDMGYSYNIKSRQMFEANATYGKGIIKLSDYTDYGVNASWKYTLLKINSRCFTDIGAGVYFEYESVSNFEFQLIRKYTVLGVIGYVEEEIYLFQGLYFIGKINQFYNSKTNAKFNYGIGIKYNF